MPVYQVRNPAGQLIEIKGDKPPTRDIVEGVFTQAFVQEKGGEEQFADALAKGIGEATQGQEMSFEDVKPESQLDRERREQRIREEIADRQDRRYMAEIDPATGKTLPGEGLTTWEKVRDIVLTPEVADDPEAGIFTKTLAGLGLTTRALGSASGQGEITDPKTKILRPLATKLDKWAETREAMNASADDMIGALNEAVRKAILSGNIPKENIQGMVDQIDKLEEQKNSGVLTTAVSVVDNILIDFASDPGSWPSIVNAVLSKPLLYAARGGAKKIIGSSAAKKLAIKKGLGIPNDEMLHEIANIPGGTVKEKLKYLRINKYDENALQTSGRFKPSAIEKAIGDTDTGELQKILNEIETSFASEVKSAESLAKGRETAIKGAEKANIAEAKRGFTRASEEIEIASVAKQEEKASQYRRLSQKAKDKARAEETLIKKRTKGEIDVVSMEKDEAIKGVDSKLRGDGIDVEDSVGKVTGEGEFSGVGKNVGFEEMERLSKGVEVSDKGRKGLLKHMAEVATGGKSEGVNYDAVAETLFKMRKEASAQDFEKAIRAVEKKYKISIPKDMATTYKQILKGDANSLRQAKGDLNKILAQTGEITSDKKVLAQGLKSHFDKVSETSASDDIWKQIIGAKEYGGDIKESIDTFREVAGIKSSPDAVIIGKIGKEKAVQSVDKWMDKAAKEFVENGLKFPRDTKTMLLQWKKHLNLDIIGEVRKKAKLLEGKKLQEAKASIITDVKKKGVEAIKGSEEAFKATKKGLKTREARELARVRNAVKGPQKKLIGKRREVIDKIKTKASNSLRESEMAKAKTINELEAAYKAKSSVLGKEIDALIAKGKNPTEDFNKIVDFYIDRGSFQMDASEIKAFRKKYGDKLTDMIPDAGIMAMLDISPKGKLLRNDELFSVFKGIRVAPSASAQVGAFGEGVVNSVYSKIRPYEARLERAFKRIKKVDVLTAKRMNKAYKKGKASEKELVQFREAMESNPLVTGDILLQEFKTLEPLSLFDKVFLLNVVESTTEEYTNRQKMSAKRILKNIEGREEGKN